MIPDRKSETISDFLLLVLFISTVTVGVLYSQASTELSETRAQLQAERANGDRLEATIRGMLMLGGAR